MKEPDSDLRAVYRDTVLQHSRDPHHFGRPPHSNREATGFNPLCGDKLTMYLQVSDGIVSEVAFEGSGCAISMASASMLTDALRGESEADAHARIGEVQAMLTEGTQITSPGLEDMNSLQGVRQYPSRVKCATLAWHAADAALKQLSKNVSTEQDT